MYSNYLKKYGSNLCVTKQTDLEQKQHLVNVEPTFMSLCTDSWLIHYNKTAFIRWLYVILRMHICKVNSINHVNFSGVKVNVYKMKIQVPENYI